jgi:hypothetical protein
MNTQQKVSYLWYQVMTALDEDREAQINGTVVIYYFHGLTADHTDLVLNGCAGFLFNLPFRRVVMHFCYDNPILRPLMALIQSLIERQTLFRFRHHYGKQLLFPTPKAAFLQARFLTDHHHMIY